jgi:hypothetical protein
MVFGSGISGSRRSVNSEMPRLLGGKEANGVILSDHCGSNMKGASIVMGCVEPNSLVPVHELVHGKLLRLCQIYSANLSVFC